MQAVEGLTVLIGLADKTLKLNDTYGTEAPRFSEAEEKLQLATSVCQAMLNTALPVARWRCFVQIESGRGKGREFTICAVNIEDIVTALYPLSNSMTEVYIQLWEQRATGADMLEGFQGWTKRFLQNKKDPRRHALRNFLETLRKYSASQVAH